MWPAASRLGDLGCQPIYKLFSCRAPCGSMLEFTLPLLLRVNGLKRLNASGTAAGLLRLSCEESHLVYCSLWSLYMPDLRGCAPESRCTPQLRKVRCYTNSARGPLLHESADCLIIATQLAHELGNELNGPYLSGAVRLSCCLKAVPL